MITICKPTLWEYYKVLELARTSGLPIKQTRRNGYSDGRYSWDWFHFLAVAIWLVPGLVKEKEG